MSAAAIVLEDGFSIVTMTCTPAAKKKETPLPKVRQNQSLTISRHYLLVATSMESSAPSHHWSFLYFLLKILKPPRLSMIIMCRRASTPAYMCAVWRAVSLTALALAASDDSSVTRRCNWSQKHFFPCDVLVAHAVCGAGYNSRS